LKEESEDAKYLDIEQVEDEMIKQLEVKVSRFQEIQNRGAKFNIWQEKLEIQSTPFNQIEELQEIVEKRHLLWKSRIEWKKLTDGYKKSLFKQINEKEIKDKCTIYDKYCNQLERALEPNAIAEELRAAVEDYKGAMPIV
jgi:protein subunit release factor A